MRMLMIFALMLGGCAMGEKTPPEMGAAGECKAEPAAGLVGQTPSADLGARALALTGARTIRWVLPGQAVTMDYRPDRLTVSINGDYKVERLSCG